MGEDLGPLSSKELESLERQLAVSLKLIRSTRVLAPTNLPDYIDFIVIILPIIFPIAYFFKVLFII